jgi:hypothetical protein
MSIGPEDKAIGMENKAGYVQLSIRGRTYDQLRNGFWRGYETDGAHGRDGEADCKQLK